MIQLKRLLLTEKVVLPVTISGNYKVPAGNCDGLHHFEKYGKINTRINKKLMELYNDGYDPDIESVKITIDSQTGSVNWSVTIKENTKGIAYTGFYTRGGGGGPSKFGYPKYLTDTNGTHHTSIEQVKTSSKIRQRGTIDKISTIYVKEHYPDKGCNIKQFFYKYSLKEYPANNVKNDINKSEENFISKMLPTAIKHKNQFQIPISITLAQAWLESGKGESTLTTKYHNWFGITCGGASDCVTLTNKQTGREISWRKYDTDQQSFDDYARLLNTRYKKYVESDDPANDYEAWARALTKGGYANTNYGDFLINLIKQQNFDKHDSLKYIKSENNVEKNLELQYIIGSLYYILCKNPSKHFNKFKNWNPFDISIANVITGGDVEDIAANYFNSWFDKKFKLKLNAIKNNSSKENQFNINSIKNLVKQITNAIRSGESTIVDLVFYKFDLNTNTYIKRIIEFNWDYL